MASGKTFLAYISSNGTSGGTKTAVEYQGDMDINTGKTNESTPFKNGTLTEQGNAGWSASFDMAVTAPLATGANLVRSASNNGGDAYMWFEGTQTGSVRFAGAVKVSITGYKTGVNGVRLATVQINENGNMTETTV